MLDRRAELRDRNRVQVVHEEHHVRIAHGDAAGRAGERRMAAQRHVQRRRVVLGRQRDVLPAQAGLAHVHAHQPLAGAGRDELAGLGFHDHPVGPGRLHQQPAHAARAVAAGADFLAVGVPEPHAGVDALAGGRRFERDELVAADAGVAVGDRAHLVGARRKRRAAGLDHDEVVAEPVHLQKWTAHGRGHIGQDDL